MRKLALLIVTGLLLVLAVPAFADETIQMGPQSGYTNTGTARITALGNNQIRVEVTVNGLVPNEQRAGHIHRATCAAGGPVIYQLNPVSANAQGVGTSSTVVTLAQEPIAAGNAYVQYHAALNPPGPGVVCGNITMNYNAQTQPAAPSTLPRTGESDLLVLGGLAAAGLVAAGFALRRRRI